MPSSRKKHPRWPLLAQSATVSCLLSLAPLTSGCGGQAERALASDGGSTGQGAGGSSGGSSAEGGSGGAQGGSSGDAQGGSDASGGSTSTGGATGSGGTFGSGGGGTGPCASPLVECAGDCVDITNTADHCGACNQECDPESVCVRGVCTTQCEAPATRCGDACSDLTIDAANCGECGHRCSRGTPCIRGACGCPDGSVACAGTCVDISSDSNNCGACGSACAGNAICHDGRCECGPETLLCAGTCVSPNDPEHCGSCDQRCDSDELCANGQCRGKDLPCPTGTTRCGSVCVDPLSTPAHCGSCEHACGGAQFCLEGECTCGSGLWACDSTCVDVASNPLHCGDCDNVCGVGQACQNGVCACNSPTAEICDGACVETATDVRHCGTCNNRCTSLPCTEGECRCPTGEALCGDRCVNVESDAGNCGACNNACPAEESCILGECSDAISDGCSNMLARGISLAQLALYQSGKVQLMSAGSAVDTDQRAADVVAGKPALLRAFVNLESGWVNRVLSARLVLVNQDADTLFQKRSVSVSSSESSLATTFNFDLPGELIQPGTSYSLELVECESGSGAVFTPRFPSGGTEELQAREVGSLKIQLVPIVTNGMSPHTDAAHLDPLTSYLQSMYPIASLQVSVGPAMEARRPLGPDSGWEQIVQQLSQQHEADDAPNDLYYYGLLEPEATFEEFCADNECTLGIGYVASASVNERHHRVSMGLSYADLYSAETMAHEVGHNHGREHAPCGGPADPDPDYPYLGARLGWWGFVYPDVLLSPTSTIDIMSYCEGPWISDYTYQGILNRVATINSAAVMLAPSPRGHFRVAIITSAAVSWGVAPRGEVTAAGTPEPALVLDQSGRPLLQVTVYRMRMDRPGSASIMVPEPAVDWYAVQFQGQLPLAFPHQAP